MGRVEGESASSSRFQILRKLGAGGMGAVYLALDRATDQQVALKTLLHHGGREIYRFKREFRSLADVVHPGLVRLHELHTAGEEWFFTMEWIDGVDFCDYVRPHRQGDAALPGPDATSPTGVLPSPTRERSAAERSLDEARLRAALYQLTDGVLALHAAGVLHRDLKPSNVLVDSGGRVVLLDFGLAAEAAGVDLERTHDAGAVGTPMYMSPEQAADVPLTEASDWYSVGVILYEALTGLRPFEDRVRSGDLFLIKQTETPIPVERLRPEAPADLADLCARLLERDPRARACGEDILAVLARSPSSTTQALRTRRRATPFVGRADALDILERAYRDSRRGSIAVRVRGPGGIGKSTLVRHFLATSPRADDALVLHGRCFERESVPHKALDELVDALCRHLAGLPDPRISELVGAELADLARLFPVLKRLRSRATPTTLGRGATSPTERRRSGFAALRAVLARLAAERPVVLYIDDLQWGDVDSVALLASLLDDPTATPLLLVLASRSEDEDRAPVLSALVESFAETPSARLRELDLGPLSTEESVALLAALTGEAGEDEDELAELAAQTEGLPLLIAELAHADRSAHGLSLDRLIGARIAALSTTPRALLSACALAGPMPLRMALRVVGGGDGEEHVVAELRDHQLIRERQAAGDRVVGPLHDRVRESCLAALSDHERRQLHRALALAYEQDETSRTETLVEHWLGAGDVAKVALYARRAAEAAEQACAFHRAADYYRLVLDHTETQKESRRELMTRCGDALINAGRLEEAIELLGVAADESEGDERLDHRLRQVEQMFRRGQLESGLECARELLRATRVRLPTTNAGAVAEILAQSARLRLRRDRRGPGAEPSPPIMRRLELLWSLASALGHLAPLRGHALQLRFVREALAHGNADQVLRARAAQIVYASMAGSGRAEEVERLYRQALALLGTTSEGQRRGRVESAHGIALLLQGQWRAAAGALSLAEGMLSRDSPRARWELDLTRIMLTSAWRYQGSIAQMRAIVPGWLRDARERGDTYLERGLQGTRANLMWLARDQPDEAERRLDAVATRRDRDLHTLHFYELMTRVNIALYRGDSAAAAAHVEADWRAIQRNPSFRTPLLRLEASYLRARALLANAGNRDRAIARQLERCARTIARQRVAGAAPMAAALHAALAHRRGEHESSMALLSAAADGFDAAGMALHAAAARYHLGGSDRSVADAAMTAEQIARPDRFAALHVVWAR